MYVAQVPPVYHVPPLIKQPVCVPLVKAFQYPDPDTVPGVPVADADDNVLEVLFVTEVKVVLATEELLPMEVVVEVLGTIEVLKVVEVLETTDVLLATEELEDGAGLPDFGRY